ncbi:hypothetical protein MMC13_003235 [Lambiella insularis]|nr:hypothetical protein [Lambiella insularis]
MNNARLGPGLVLTDQSNAQKTSGSVMAARQKTLVGLPSGPKPYRAIAEPATDGSATTISHVHKATTTMTPGPVILKPRPIPQWPLSSEDGDTKQMSNFPLPIPFSHGGGKPPQRPPRPTYVPSILDTSRLRDHTPVYQYRQPLSPPGAELQQDGNYWDRNYPLSSPSTDSAPLGTPKTAHSGTSFSSSRLSTSSSVGSIPDFPVPTIPAILPLQPTRRALGPPPSSRRGASSYYSQNSFVAPIPEEAAESVKNSHGSFASSHVMPTSWGDDLPESYVLDEDKDDEVGDGADSRSSRSGDHDESTSLVRKLSLGRRQKPLLTNLKGPDDINKEDLYAEPDNTENQEPVGMSKPNMISRAAVSAAALEEARITGLQNARNGPTSSEHDKVSRKNALLNPTTVSGGFLKSKSATGSRDPSPGRSSLDPRVRHVLGGLEKGGAIAPGTLSPITSPSSEGVNRNKVSHRQDSLDAVKDQEVRGSLTSLPELIRRATRLASNLDRGKTASRLGLFDMLNASDLRTEKGDGRVRSGSITNILASFPPPALNSTPTSSRGRPTSRWPSPFANADELGQHSSFSDYKPEIVKQNSNRRCCGMPLWGFIILMMILFLLVAAAVIIPVTLIVIPRQNAQSAADAAVISLSNCRSSTPCANGGTSLVSGNACSCVCANGFTGPNCGQTADTGCTTINVNSTSQSSSYKNATVGSSIPRLLSASLSNYSIPLNYSAILAVFSATNLSCSSENALVQFNGASQRRDVHPAEQLKPFEVIGMRAATVAPRAPVPQATPNPVTSNGIIFAGSTTTSAATFAATASSTISVSAASSTIPSSLPNGEVAITQRDLDFARISVLFVLQESSLDAAITAQQSLQGVLIGNTFQSGKESVLVGSNVTVNFLTRSILLANGTVIGGKAR